MKEICVKSFDTLVVGGGIGGLQAALDLADQGYKVAIVERDPSIGGKMIRLSKVFPTLDCASCITTPKMAAAAHHPNITLFTYTELKSVEKNGNGFEARILKIPRYVDESKCIGCRRCEYVCPVIVNNQDQGDLCGRKAVYIPFPNAIPQIALIDPQNCLLCGRCEGVCPTGAIDYFQEPYEVSLHVGSVLVSTGYKLLTEYPEKAFGKKAMLSNVINSLQMERILAPHGPYNRVLRPSDGKEPDSVAFIQCAGSRDSNLGVPYCSRVCCMYAIKQAMLLSGALPLADITIFYIDIRAFGKNYEQFFQNAKAMGIQFIKARPLIVGEGDDQKVILRYEDQEGGGGKVEAEYDLVILSLAMVPAWNPEGVIPVSRAEDSFIRQIRPKISPALTDTEGIFVAGTASGPKDIVDTIVEGGSAAMEVANYLRKKGWKS